jgi:hypothetical protein
LTKDALSHLWFVLRVVAISKRKEALNVHRISAKSFSKCRNGIYKIGKLKLGATDAVPRMICVNEICPSQTPRLRINKAI